jgi:hypothetical protein
MRPTALERLVHGTRHFLCGDAEELLRVLPDAELLLPRAQRVFLEDELATPLVGFPVLVGEGTEAFRHALEEYLGAEIKVQSQVLRGAPVEPKPRDRAWDIYAALLSRITENAARSTYSRRYTSILWLYHSQAVATCFRELPLRVRRLDLELGRGHGDRLKYELLERYLERVLALTYDTIHRIADEAEEAESELFPELLVRMRDNVLILSEEHVGPDLAELTSYFRGYLGIDPNGFRAELAALAAWNREEWSRNPVLRAAGRHLAGQTEDVDPEDLMRRPGWASFLAALPGYPGAPLPEAERVALWESLLVRLKEFELLGALRRQVYAVRRAEGGLVAEAPAHRDGWVTRPVRLSPSTRPIEFTSPWIVDPLVSRFGLVYDIADFSAIVSLLRHAGRDEEDRSYRSIFLFQRRVNRMAAFHRLQLEKYLGDGALYSSRHPRRALAAAIHLQRFYRRALRERFPFDRGLRIALNYGQYRLLPVEEGLEELGRRYEFFGRGIIELSRLVTGKTSHAVEEIKTFLLTLGYSATEVDRFFAPLGERRVDLVDTLEEARDFYAYINHSGTLINEGIVATDRFVAQLAELGVSSLETAEVGERSYVRFTIDEGSGKLPVGLRRLGVAQLKGLARQTIYEIADAAQWSGAVLGPAAADDLRAALDRIGERPVVQRQGRAAGA